MSSPPDPTGVPRIKPGRRLSMHQVLDFQLITHEAALGLAGDFRGTHDKEERARVALAIASLGKSWTTLQDSKREILGRPKAGILRPERKKSKRPRQAGRLVDVESVVAQLKRQELAEASVG